VKDLRKTLEALKTRKSICQSFSTGDTSSYIAAIRVVRAYVERGGSVGRRAHNHYAKIMITACIPSEVSEIYVLSRM
jgi:hypothetical protein